MKNSFIKAVICLLGFAPLVEAQQHLDLKDVVDGSLVRTERGGYVDWMEDGDRYSEYEKNANGQWQVVSYKVKGGEKQVVIPAEALINPETGKSIAVRSFYFNKDHSYALIYTNTRRVWRYDTRGD